MIRHKESNIRVVHTAKIDSRIIRVHYANGRIEDYDIDDFNKAHERTEK